MLQQNHKTKLYLMLVQHDFIIGSAKWNKLMFYIGNFVIIRQTIEFSHVFPLRNVTTKKLPPPLPQTSNWRFSWNKLPLIKSKYRNCPGYTSLASQNPYPIIVYSVANYRPHLGHFWANVIVISRTEFNANRLLIVLKQQQKPFFNRDTYYL